MFNASWASNVIPRDGEKMGQFNSFLLYTIHVLLINFKNISKVCKCTKWQHVKVDGNVPFLSRTDKLQQSNTYKLNIYTLSICVNYAKYGKYVQTELNRFRTFWSLILFISPSIQAMDCRSVSCCHQMISTAPHLPPTGPTWTSRDATTGSTTTRSTRLRQSLISA